MHIKEIGLALSILSADDNQIQMVSTESANINIHGREDRAISDNHNPLGCVGCYSLNSGYYEQLIHS